MVQWHEDAMNSRNIETIHTHAKNLWKCLQDTDQVVVAFLDSFKAGITAALLVSSVNLALCLIAFMISKT